MTRLIESSKFLAYIAIIAILLLAVAVFGWGTLKALDAVRSIVLSFGEDPEIAVKVLVVVDAFLIGMALLVVAASMHELFLFHLNLPDWMLAHDLHELKAKLSGVIILIMVVKFVEKVVEWHDPQATLQMGIAIAVISAALIGMTYFNKTD